MSPPHDWLRSLGPGHEASADAQGAGEAGAEAGAEGAGTGNDGLTQTDGAQVTADSGFGEKTVGEKTDGGSASVEGDSVGEASSGDASADGEADQGADAHSQADATPKERGRSGWSGRAVGPLSGLLPGAVELNADELPVQPAASEVAVGDANSAISAADDQPASTAEGVDADGAPAGEAPPAAQRDEAVEAPEEREPSLSATDDRWHAVLVGFVDDPRGSVEAARALIDQDIATHLALLARRKDAMHAAWEAGKDADTEALRVALVNYRDLRKRLADVLDALTP